jgi:phage portal protein BeeE
MFGWFKRQKTETRSSVSSYTAEIMAARESYIAGRSGLAELTATVQACVALWEGGLTVADVDGAEDLLTPRIMQLAARGLALRGEAVFLVTENGLVPVANWDVSTRDGAPTAYRLMIPEVGGGRTEVALAGQVLHFRIGCDPATPFAGQSPLRRASLSAGLLNAIEAALAEVWENAPIGSSIVPFPETAETSLEALGRGFRGKRGRVLLRESTNVSAAGGAAPNSDWRPQDTTPDLTRVVPVEALGAARDGIASVFGVLPCLLTPAAQGPAIREAQRHLAQWTLAPIAGLIAEEATLKLGVDVAVDVVRPVQAHDASGKARAFATIISALSEAKTAGVDTAMALRLLAWESDGD